jgi:hypothetical protein
MWYAFAHIINFPYFENDPDGWPSRIVALFYGFLVGGPML